MPDATSNKPPKQSTFRSISKQLTKIASSASNTSGSDENLKPIDDVPLNKKAKAAAVTKKTGSSKKAKVAPATASSAVIGNKDLKLKVSHNDQGRVVISLSNPDRVLVQVHVDESVLKTKGSVLKKKTKTSSKEVPKKKSTTVAKQTKKTTTTTTSSKKKGGSSSRRLTGSEPRDLPDEQRVDRSRSSRRSERQRATVISQTAVAPPPQISSAASVASDCYSIHSDDSTRSPRDLNRTSAPPKTPHISKKQFGAPSGDTPSTEPSLAEDDITSTASFPTWDKRRQKMIHARQNSKLMADPPSGTTTSDRAPELHDEMDTGTEAKLEEGADNLSLFSSPMQQRRLQHRQKRLEKQRTEGGENFRSTRSIRSTGASTALEPPSIELDASATSAAAVPNADNQTIVDSVGSNNRATHVRTVNIMTPHPDEDDDSATANSSKNNAAKRIQATLDEVRKVELTNKGDHRSGRSSYRNSADNHYDMDQSLLGGSSKTGCNLFSKICDKVCHPKRCRKGGEYTHQKL